MKKVFVLILMLLSVQSFATGIASNTPTAPCDNATLAKYSGTVNAEINWEPNTIGLRWYNGDQQIAGQASCVYDGTITVPPQPTKPGYTFNGWKVMSAIPEGYTQLEYIETTGTQYIRTPYGINAQNTSDNGNFDFSLDIQFTNVNSRIVFGYALNSDTYWGTSYSGQTTYSGIHGEYSLLTRHTLYANTVIDVSASKVIFNNSKVCVNGQIVATGSDYRSNTVPGGLLRVPQESFNDYPAHAKLYGLIQNQRGELVFHGIPARRNSDNTLGMWDTVSQTFFTNAGTGNFIAGPVVQ